MKKFFTAAILIALATTLYAAAPQPGDRAPEFTIENWLRNGPLRISRPADIRSDIYYAVVFWGTWSKQSTELFPFLSYMHRKYYSRGLLIVAISSEKPEVIEKFLEKQGEIEFTVAADRENTTSAAFLSIDSIPTAFIVESTRGKIMWKGDLSDMERIFEKILSGNFDIDEQKKISSLRKELMLAMQTGSDVQVEEKCESILRIDKRDPVALRCMLMLFEEKKEPAKAFEFIEKMLDRDPDNSTLYFIKSDLMARNGKDASSINAFLKKFREKFSNDPAIMNNFANFVVDTQGPPAEALPAAESAAKSISGRDDALTQALYIVTLAKVYAYLGHYEFAAAAQEKAVKLLEGKKDYKDAVKKLEQYKSISSAAKNLKMIPIPEFQKPPEKKLIPDSLSTPQTVTP